MVPVLKTGVGQLTASSNLALSAKKKYDRLVVFFLVVVSFDLSSQAAVY